MPEVAALTLIGTLIVSNQAPGEPALTPSAVRDQVGLRVEAALERASPAEHLSHGHEVGEPDRVLCVVEVLGTDPADAVRVGSVRAVYGYHMCAVGPPGTPFKLSRLNVGPVVAKLGEPISIEAPPPGANLDSRLRAVMPDDYRERAMRGFSDAGKPAELGRRFTRLVTEATALPPRTR